MDTEDVSEMDIRGHSTDIYLEKKKLAQLKRRLIILVVLVSSVVCVLLFRQLFALQ